MLATNARTTGRVARLEYFMLTEPTNRICPLCRRAAAGNGLPARTRLCDGCRAMLETIIPQKAFSNGNNSVSSQYAVAAARQIEVAAPIEFETQAGASAPVPQVDDYEMVSLEPVIDDKEDFLEEPEESFAGLAAPDEKAFNATASNSPLVKPEAFAPPARFEIVDSPSPSEMAETTASPSAEAQNDSNAFIATVDRPEIETEQIAAQTHDSSDLKTSLDENATDPWDDPLPAWEYSRNEWPIALTEQRPKSFARFAVPIAIAALIAGVALVYFIVTKPRPEDSQPPLSVYTPDPTEQQPAAGTAPSATAQPATSSLAPAPDASSPAPIQETPSNDGNETKWRHSLQAMASQNADEANQFAERLVRAGVPAYVISADLGSRGIWHRVRVGRFNTADEAQRFAVEARARAKAAGVTLKQLNLCEYEKP